ncbi:DUF1990 family protein [Streptomyces xiaopingdaonensis]|uniref:DUF1990 family protein n=1 Tax=Streptomyces xiaopingdaonensis TaxID=1565415 RepID=UPI0002ED3CDE|nr:DUF1990 domain-containing protein [Streptomyces xiaopingdaonensis]
MAYHHLDASAASELTYRAVGATAGRLPPGLPGALCVRTRIGRGRGVFAVAARELSGFRMHRAMGVEVSASAPRAAPGVRVLVGIGPRAVRVRCACRVVWTRCDGSAAGWAYGTLPGHPLSGEEAFALRLEPDETVVLTVTAFSSPAVGWARAALPLVRLFQRAYAHWCGAVLRRLVRSHRHRAGDSGKARNFRET